MSILTRDDTRLIVQGITGREGSYHTRQMMLYGTNVVGGVTPGKGGEWEHGKPVFDTVTAAIDATGANASLIAVSAPAAADAIYEAIDAGMALIVCITDGIPVLDMVRVYTYLQGHSARLIGPNSPGILSPGECSIGIIPTGIARAGTVGIVSRSGSLMYEVISALTDADIGQSTCVGIGGDPVIGTRFVDVLQMFEDDPQTDRIIMLGEIGGRDEIAAAEYIKARITKPVSALIAGRSAPAGVRMGHAGAVVDEPASTAIEKIDALRSAGVQIADTPVRLADLIINEL
ncbi:MAG: succinate--CoA ligase subunit alpha [Blastochloris sp.]|nr:succinate--CoA ligase subunit alpha [Blastochloris sp.]